jgi:multiple sugar transport system substrate-binding protein
MSHGRGSKDSAASLTRLDRRGFLKVAGAGLAGATLAGMGTSCFGGGEDAATGGGNGGSQGAATVTWWDYFEAANGEAMDNAHRRYMDENPNITIERRAIPFADLKRTLLQGATAARLPDVVVIDNPDHQAFAELGILEDITDRVESWGEGDAYFDGPWQSTLWEGRSYGVPDNSNCLTLWVNNDVLSSAGAGIPADWDELVAASEALTTADRFGLAVCAVKSEEGTFQWLPFLWQAGADIPSLDSEGGRAAMQLWVDLVERGYMSEGILGWTQEDAKNQFVAGRAAMMVNGPWQIPVVTEEAADLKWEVAVLPEGEQPASILGGENQAIIKDSPNVDAAWDLMTWFHQPENLKTYLVEAGKLPSREDLADDPEWSDDAALSVFVDQLRVAKPRAYGSKYPEISTAIQDAMQASISGQQSVEDALAQAQETVTPLLP